MTRATLGATNRAEVGKSAVRLEYMCSVALPSGTLRGITGDRNVVYGGNTYYGNAIFSGFSGISEVPDLKARRVKIQLSGVSASVVAAAMTDKYHYAELNLYLAFFDEAWALIADPHQLGVSLYTSDITISLGDKSGSILVSAETLEVFNRRNSAVLMTPESQKRRYPGDTGMDRVRATADTEFEWGNKRYGSVLNFRNSTGCPAPWVPVRLADGSEIAASSLRRGMLVAGWDEATLEQGVFEVEDVTYMEAQRAMLVTTDGRRIEASTDHPVYVRETGFVAIADLRPGDELVGDMPAKVQSVTPSSIGPCVRITIKQAHTFMTAGILSHNKQSVTDNDLRTP